MMTKRIVCIAGPTASGKSASVLALAQHYPIELICVDSATIYQGMDIGTAKPTPAEQALVPHHLLDICDPTQSYSAAQFCQDAFAFIDAIQARGRLPIFVGGTMMYYKALREGLNNLPSADPALRQRLEKEASDQGWPALHAKLATLDPITAQRLSPNDSQRIERALEVCLLTGQAMSTLLQAQKERGHDERFVTISLEPSDRLALHQRIAQRFDAMLAQGFVEEVQTLKARPDLNPDLPSIRCVGYRQLWAYLEGEVSYEQAREQGIAATRQLAKRQITWLRSQPDRIQIDCLASNVPEQVLQQVETILRLN